MTTFVFDVFRYLKCCPECRCRSKTSINFPTQIPKLKYFFGFAVPRIVMFGAGLDSSGLVKRILWNKVSPFEVKGMFPGQFGGKYFAVYVYYVTSKTLAYNLFSI